MVCGKHLPLAFLLFFLETLIFLSLEMLSDRIVEYEETEPYKALSIKLETSNAPAEVIEKSSSGRNFRRELRGACVSQNLR